MTKIKIFLSVLFISASLLCVAQNKPTDVDKSPMDVSYLPQNYPLLKLNGKAKDQPVARLLYSRPQKNGRVIFDGIVKYGEMWRLGANEATEIEFFKAVKVGGKSISKGKYTLYCIPTADKWTLIINKDNFSWGNFSYDIKKDVARVDCKVEKNTEIVEAFTAYFDETKATTNLTFMWDDVKVLLPISY